MNSTVDIEDQSQLIDYLQKTGRIEPSEKPLCTKLAGGVSNKTIWIQIKNSHGWVLKQALSRLRVKADWVSDPRRIQIEANALRYLPSLTPAGTITPLVFEDPDECILAMLAVPQPHQNWKQCLLRGELDPAQVQNFATILGHLHYNSSLAAANLQCVFDDRSFFQSLRLEPYFQFSATAAPAARPFLSDFRQVHSLPWSRDLEPRAVRHTAACLLARTVGRSPLEYLSDCERTRQRQAALILMRDPPSTVAELIERFLETIAA